MVRNLLVLLCIITLAACGGDGRSGLDGGPEGFAPTLSVDGVAVGLQPVSVQVDENTVNVATISTTGGSLSLSAADDGALFTLSSGGELAFIDAPDFENPGGDGSNTYTVRIDALGNLSASVTLSVQVQNVLEGIALSGRVIDGPVAGALVYADMNCDREQTLGEPEGVTDDNGFFSIELPSEPNACVRIYSVGGVDTVTNKPLSNIQLASPVPSDRTKPAQISPLSTIISAATTDEERAGVLIALGLSNITVEELLTTDVWAGSQNAESAVSEEEIAAATLAQAVQRLNTQIATVIKVATSLSAVSQTGAATQSSIAAAVAEVAKEIVAQTARANEEAITTGVVVRVNLASASVVQSVIEKNCQRSG